MTVLSKRMRRPLAAAAAATSGQLQATGPLLAVTTSMPRRNASRTWSVAAGRYDATPAATPERSPMTVSSTRTSAPEAASSSAAGRGACGGAGPSPTAASTCRRRQAGGLEQAAVARAGGGHEHAQPVALCEHALLGGEQLAQRARDAAEAEQAEPDHREVADAAGSSSKPARERLTSRGAPAGVAAPALIASSARGRRPRPRGARARPPWCTGRARRAPVRRGTAARAARPDGARRSRRPR